MPPVCYSSHAYAGLFRPLSYLGSGQSRPFLGTFREVVDLLQLNSHTISSENHNAMLVVHLNRYLNKGLRIMTNERDSTRVACEAISLLIYAWNSAPIPGTDLRAA